MEMETTSSVVARSKDDDDDVPLPGFRFHPTDEELVGFYLKRKVEKRPISIELIKQIDIYKFDPWDLPKASNVGEKEWYFFCKRGRKYRNSIRPNRVTGSGFWKATGIDRPIYSAGGEGRDCIGLKKSLVYYRGSAGKGTKTDWMMHEFRLPSEHEKTSPKQIDAKSIVQEAEVWTLCRIFKRNVSYRKCMPDWKELSGSKKSASAGDAASKTCSMESSDQMMESNYISFSSTAIPAAVNNFRVKNNIDRKPFDNPHHGHVDIANQLLIGQLSASVSQTPPPWNTAPYHASLAASSDLSEFLNLKHEDWEELRSMFEFGAAK